MAAVLHVSPLVSHAIAKEIEVTEINVIIEIKRTFSEDSAAVGNIQLPPMKSLPLSPLTSLK